MVNTYRWCVSFGVEYIYSYPSARIFISPINHWSSVHSSSKYRQYIVLDACISSPAVVIVDQFLQEYNTYQLLLGLVRDIHISYDIRRVSLPIE